MFAAVDDPPAEARSSSRGPEVVLMVGSGLGIMDGFSLHLAKHLWWFYDPLLPSSCDHITVFSLLAQNKRSDPEPRTHHVLQHL